MRSIVTTSTFGGGSISLGFYTISSATFGSAPGGAVSCCSAVCGFAVCCSTGSGSSAYISASCGSVA